MNNANMMNLTQHEEVEAEDDEEDMDSLLHCTQVRFRICFIFQVSYHCISNVKDAAI